LEFLKKHYEKLILASLLLAFIISMVYLMYIIKDTAAITKAGFQIPSREPNVKASSADDPKFNMTPLLAIGRSWSASGARNPKFKDFTSDLVTVFAAARCGHCQRIIPRYFFDNHNCPLCGKELLPPIEGDIHVGPIESIPKDVKAQYGGEVNELDDMDGDGFSNLYEYKQKTLMNAANSHPPMWHRLVLARIDKVKLPFMLMKVNTNGSPEKSKWDIQVNRTDTGKTNFTMLNDILKVDGNDYRIADVKLDHKERKVGNDVITEDRSVIYLEMLGSSNKMQMEVGREVFSPEPKAFIIDTGDNNRILTVDAGGEFLIGNRNTGRYRFKVKSIDQHENQVFLIQRSGPDRGKDVPEPIGKVGKIPVSERIRPQGFQPDMML
jgi:hypothetical protein